MTTMLLNGRGSFPAFAALIAANVIYATSYAAGRVALDGMPPALLACTRLLIAALLMLPVLRRSARGPALSRREFWSVAGMGIVGFGAAFWLGNWGIALSTTTNAAILVVVEPIVIMLLGPILLGERLSSREAFGAAMAVAGSLVVVVNGVPGLQGFHGKLLPHWRGDALLVLTGIAFASYSLWGRPLLERHDAKRVTALSLWWGVAALLPLAVLEWARGRRPEWTWPSSAATLYLAVAVTAIGFFLWNWALKRVEASRAAITLNIQPVLGSLLGVLWLKERMTVFTIFGGLLIVSGLFVAFHQRSRDQSARAAGENGGAYGI